MSAPAEPVPTLELPSATLMQWSQLALQLSYLLGQRREHLERLAWSDSQHAARVHELAESRAALEPAVRAMTPEEIAQWPQTPTDPTGDAALLVTAEVERIHDRWALRATTWDGQDTIRETWVSCREETLARGLASEILHRGEPAAVERLAAHVALTEALADHAATQRVQAHASPPVDREAMATHLHRTWPPHVAAAVVGCPAWPTLASKLHAAQREGHELEKLLGGITTSGIPSARKPAALASYLLDQATGADHHDRRQDPALPGPRSSLPAEGPRFPPRGPEEILSWVDQLDPASCIDRVGALGAAGCYGPAVDARLLARFGGLTEEFAPWGGDEAAALELAGDRQRSAAAQLATVDDPSTPQREDLDGQALAQRDLHDAAAAYASAAEHRGAPHAAVARANVTTTAPSTATTPRTAPPGRATTTSAADPAPDHAAQGPLTSREPCLARRERACRRRRDLDRRCARVTPTSCAPTGPHTAPTGGFRAGSGDCGARPCPAGRGMGAHLRAQQAALAAPRVLPGDPGRVRVPARRDSAPGSPRALGRRTHSTRGREADEHPARTLLAQAGRQRGIDAEVARLQAVLRAEYLHHPPLVEDVFGKQALALLRQLNVACSNASATIEHFGKHPDAEIITSMPGVGSLTGARVLAEIGDDRSRFTDARSLKAYAGAAPGTRASGKSLTVTHR